MIETNSSYLDAYIVWHSSPFYFRDDFDEQYEHSAKKFYIWAATLDSVYNFKGVRTSEAWADEELLPTDNDRKLL